MAEFIVGYPLRKIARRHEFLRRLLWRIDFALLWSLITLFRMLPVDWASEFGARVGAVVGPLMRFKTTIVEQNYRVAFPEKSPDEIRRLAKASWSNAFRIISEYPHLDHIAKDSSRVAIVVDGREPDPTFLGNNQPAILVGAHVNNWELSGAALSRLGIANSALYSPPSNPWLDRMLREARAAHKSELIPRDNSARILVKRLTAGRVIGMLVDREVKDGGKLIPFFGRDKSTTIMPAKLALKFDCDLIPVQVERTKGAHFRVIFHPPLRATNPRACEADQAIDLMRQLNELFEDWIRQQPEDWFCTKRIWPKHQPGNDDNARRERA